MRLSRRDYHQLDKTGAFKGRRVQLIAGTVITMSPMGTAHATLITRLTGLLVPTLNPLGYDVRIQLPLAVSEDSEPEPDFAILRQGSWGPDDHPATALLIIEVADSSRRLDLGPKALIYAAALVAEYWVLDPQQRMATIHTSPRRGRYAKIRHHRSEGGALSSTSIPDLEVRLEKLWPSRRTSQKFT